MSSREPTLADVAQLAGVSPTTVSRVLNNRGYLSEKTKRSVADAIATLGYRPNSLARALHGKSTQTVGLIVPAVSLPFFGELAVEVENALAEAGYRILICNSMGRAEREREYLSLLVGNRVDGIISGAHNEGLNEYDPWSPSTANLAHRSPTCAARTATQVPWPRAPSSRQADAIRSS